MMDNERVLSTKVTAVSSSDTPQEIQKCHSGERDDTRRNATYEGNTRGVIECENVPEIYIETSDEDDASEELSGDVNRTETRLALATDQGSSADCRNEFASVLHERAQKLRSEMTSLRERLSKEVALWRKEKQEFQLLREKSDALAFEEATAAARAAAAAYAAESPFSSDLDNIVDFTSERGIRDLAILEYEKNLAKYHDRHSFEQAEQRYNSYRRVLVDAYRQKLSEVERLCDEELENIRQNANCLQPFEVIASQWSIDENDRGDSQRGYDDQSESTEPSKVVEFGSNDDWCMYGKIDNEVNMIPEILSVRFKQEEAT